MRRGLALLLVSLTTVGCSWRVTPPTALDEPVAIIVVADKGRMPRVAAYLQAALANTIPVRTGWRVRPDGTARIELSVDSDQFGIFADDERSIPTIWRYTVRVSALLVCRQGTRLHHCTGNGYAGSRATEPDAMRAAANEAGELVAQWLAQVDLSPPQIP
ncbi:MAG: hypothetical protein AAB263_10640 [Planctomycetota bacterium]